MNFSPINQLLDMRIVSPFTDVLYACFCKMGLSLAISLVFVPVSDVYLLCRRRYISSPTCGLPVMKLSLIQRARIFSDPQAYPLSFIALLIPHACIEELVINFRWFLKSKFERIFNLTCCKKIQWTSLSHLALNIVWIVFFFLVFYVIEEIFKLGLVISHLANFFCNCILVDLLILVLVLTNFCVRVAITQKPFIKITRITTSH